MDTQIQGFTYRSPLLDVISKLCLNPNNNEGQIILVVGPPGSGKTVFLSQLYGILKNEVEFITAIKAEISDEDDPLKISKLFEEAKDIDKPKVLLLDSLDILATGNSKQLLKWLECLRKIRSIPFATAVCACRSFEANHLYPFNIQDWSLKYELDFPNNEWIRKVLESTVPSKVKITLELLDALRIPLNLRLAVEIQKGQGELSEAETLQSLYTKLFELYEIGESELNILIEIANEMVRSRTTTLPLASIIVSSPQSYNKIKKLGIVSVINDHVSFVHYTFIDFLLAWDIVRGKKSLIAFLLENNQALFVRPTIRFALTVLRNTPKRLWDELEPIFFTTLNAGEIGFRKGSIRIRKHIIQAILSNMASWQKPTKMEASYLLKILGQGKDELLAVQFFTSSPNSEWFRLLKDSLLLPSIKNNDRNLAIYLRYIEKIAWHYPEEVLKIGLELVANKRAPEFGRFFISICEELSQVELDKQLKTEYASLIEQVVQKDLIDWYLDLDILCSKLSKIEPKRALSLLYNTTRKILITQKELLTSISSGFINSLIDVIIQIHQIDSLSTLLVTAEFFEDIFYKSTKSQSRANESMLLDYPANLLYGEYAERFGLDALYEWFKKTSLELSKDRPKEADILIRKIEKSRWITQNQLAFLCMLENPKNYIDDIKRRLYSIIEMKPDNLSHSRDNNLLLKLIGKAFKELPQIDQQRIMARINSFSFEDDKQNLFTIAWIWKPLHTIPEDLQTPSVKAKLIKLDRQFGTYEYIPPIRSSRVGVVTSPVPRSEIEKLEAEALYEFLLANRDLKDSWISEQDKFLGGVEELAIEAVKVIVDNLDKYQTTVDKLAKLPENDIYLDYFFQELWSKEIPESHINWLIKLILCVWERDKIQLNVARVLTKLIQIIEPGRIYELKPVLVGLSFSAIDPVEDRFLEYRKEGYSNTALTEGINSTRGVMCEVILKSLTSVPEDEEYIDVLKRLAEDNTISVRASLVYYLPLGLRPLGWDKCFDLFSKASLKGLQEYTDVAGRFLQYVPKESFEAVLHLLESLFKSKKLELTKMAMSLAAIYFLKEYITYGNIKDWFSDESIDGESKEESLGILANHIQYEKYAKKVIEVFEQILVTNERIVGKSIDRIFLLARPEDLVIVKPVIEETIKRRTIRGPALYHIVEYLGKCLSIDSQLCFNILETIIDNVDEDYRNYRDFIPVVQSKVPLSILNTTFECYFDLEDRALGVLDKLIELRWPGVEEFLKDTERL